MVVWVIQGIPQVLPMSPNGVTHVSGPYSPRRARAEARSNFRRIRVHPRSAIRAREAASGFGVVGNGARLRVVGERTAEFLGKIRERATRRRDVAFFNISDRSRAILARLHEVF